MKSVNMAVGIALSMLLLSGCGTTPTNQGGQDAGNSSSTTGQSNNAGQSGSAKNISAQGKLSVLYAGSMTAVMEKKIKPDIKTNLGMSFEGEGKGSMALAQMIHSGIAQPDVFISASPGADKLLMGGANHNMVDWYMSLATDQLVIAYSPKSRFASDLKKAQAGQIPWYQVLEEPGFRFGRTDPLLDPKGVSTIYMAELAASYYHQPDLKQKILGADENPNQVFPEETLLSQLGTGQIDAIAAYKHEAVEWGVPYITLPDTINLGNTSDASEYAKATFTDNKGKVSQGAPILFTITIPATAQNIPGAQSFVKYMVSGAGHDILMKDGFTAVQTTAFGSKNAVPQTLQSLIH